jgi:hypothetical protein
MPQLFASKTLSNTGSTRQYIPVAQEQDKNRQREVTLNSM